MLNKQHKKITYIANARIPTEKAHGVAIMKMCEAFVQESFNVDLIVPRRLNKMKDNPFEYYGVEKEFKIIKLPCLDLVYFGKLGFLIQTFSFALSTTVYLLFRKNSIIYSRDEFSLFMLSFFKKNLVWEVHTARNNFIVHRIARRIKKIISITNGLKDFYVDTYNINSNKILVSSSAVDTKRFDIVASKKVLREEFLLPIDKKIIGYVGKYKTMGEEKGIDMLINIFSEVLKKNKNIFLLIVGMNENELSEVENIFDRENIPTNSYKLISHVSQIKIPRLLMSSDILIMNYPNKEHYVKYMSPLKMFEYMASGVPIVSSDLPSTREILNKDNSVLVDLSNRHGFLSAIDSILNNKKFADNISEMSKLDVRNHTWNIRAKNILNFI